MLAMIRALLTVLLIATPSFAPARPQVITEQWLDPRPAPRGAALLRNIVIAVHNDARRAYRVGPIAWNDALAADAKVYAERLARTRTFAHDTQVGRRPRQGENLWMGTRGAYRYEVMLGHLVDERRDFRPGRFPNISRTGTWSDVGHYTQIVWPTTTHVGCATASNRSDDYLVCRYLPAGNVVGTVLR